MFNFIAVKAKQTGSMADITNNSSLMAALISKAFLSPSSILDGNRIK
jgi:hypothetical protein